MSHARRIQGNTPHLHASLVAERPRGLKSGHRYNAACSAALAAAGRGEDPPVDESEKARWRKHAVEWLRADLAFCSKQAGSGPPLARAFVAGTLQHWKEDSDLAAIRDEAAVKALSEVEQKTSRTLRAEVERTLKIGTR